MRTILSDGESLEIEKKLKNTSFPLVCHFCGELITKINGLDAESLCNHHITYTPEVKVPVHKRCHQKYHNTHPDHPKNPETEHEKRFMESLDLDGIICCYFCGEEITQKYGKESESLLFHSLDGNHNNWDPLNKVPTHRRCHSRFHMKKTKKWVGDDSPMNQPKVRAKHLKSVRTPKNRAIHSEMMKGDKNPMRRPGVAAKGVRTRVERYGPFGRKPMSKEKRLAIAQKTVHTRQERYGSDGCKDPEARSEALKEAWKRRREKYGPSGVKDPEASNKAIREGHKSRSKDEKQKSVEKGIKTRRDRYGPTMRRSKVI